MKLDDFLIRKTKQGGYINERYEKLYRGCGYTALLILICMFVALVIYAINDDVWLP